MMTARALPALALTAFWSLATYAILAALGPDWTRYLPASCQATRCFCELPRTGQLMLQPSNTLSVIGYLLVGSWIMVSAKSRTDTAFRGPGVVWYGFSAVVIGVGSALLHATLTLWGQFADVVGMYLLTGFSLTYAVARWRGLNASQAALLYVTLVAALVAVLYVVPDARRYAFLVLLLTSILIEMAFARPRRPGVVTAWYLAGIAAKAVAFGIWILDNTGRVCAPTSWLQGHAVWHLLGAAAIACSYAYYRSERRAG